MTPRPFTPLDAATAVVAVGVAAFGVWMAAAGPAGPLPTHFGLDGQADRWGDRSQVAGLLLALALLAAVVAGSLGWHARRSDDPARRRGLRAGQLVSLLVFVGLAALVGASVLGRDAGALQPGWTMGGLGLILALTGAALGRVGPNPLVGVRTPWSYKSRLAWDRSNRLAGRLFFWLGLTALAAAPFAHQPAGTITLVVGVLAAAAWSVFESWRVWRADPDRQPF